MNVIDSLVVTLGLDPTQFTKGQKEAANSFLKTKQEAEKSGKAIEDSAAKTANAISKITREVLSLYAVFLGARGIKEFVQDLTLADAALGRFSRNLDQSPQTIAAWGNAAERMGGSAEATAGSFERIGKALYDLHRNGQMLPKEFSQLQALTGRRISTDNGVDKFLQDTAAALKAMNAIDPSQAHFLAQGMGIDDATANVMIKYGDAIGAYIDQIKKLSPSNDAIKAAQELQDKWSTLQQTAVSLANTILSTLGPQLSDILTKMTNWVTANQDWIKSGVVDGVRQFAEYLKSIDWNAVGAGLKSFGEDAHKVADAIGGITTATEILFALWAGSKALGVLGSIRTAVGGSAAASASGGSTGIGLAGVGGTIALLLAGKSHLANDPEAQRRQKAFNDWRQGIIGGKNAQPDYGALTRDAGAHGEALNGDTTVDGRAVSKSNPMPVVISGQQSGGGFWSSVGNAISTFFGGAANASTGKPGDGLSGIAGTPVGSPSLTGSNKEVVDYIRQSAIAHGIDPNIALRVANHEGLRGYDPTKPDRGGDGGSSFTPFQLHYGGINPAMPHAGLGDVFTKETGLDARDPKNWRAAIDFALDQARKGGWGPWMGARAEGITGKYGVGPLPMTPPIPSGARMAASLSSIQNDQRVTTSSSSNEMHVGTINVNAPNATDSNGIAGKITDSLYRSSLAATANYGPR